MIIKFLSSSSSLSLELTHVPTVNVGVSSFMDHIWAYERDKEEHVQKICDLNKRDGT